MSVDPRTTGSSPYPALTAVLRLRFTILFLVVMVMANLLAGSLGHALPNRLLAAWGIGHDAVLSGEVFRLVTGTFLSHDQDMFVRQFIFAAVVLGHTEWVRGTGRVAALFFGLDIAGTLILLACVGWGAGMVDLTSTNDVGMSIGGFGLVGLAIAGWRGKWLLLAGTLAAICTKFVLAPDAMADGGHVLALCLGFALGIFLAQRHLPGENCHAQ